MAQGWLPKAHHLEKANMAQSGGDDKSTGEKQEIISQTNSGEGLVGLKSGVSNKPHEEPLPKGLPVRTNGVLLGCTSQRVHHLSVAHTVDPVFTYGTLGGIQYLSHTSKCSYVVFKYITYT